MAGTKSTLKTFEITERSSIPGNRHHRSERKALFYIVYDGKIKELVFKHEYYEKIDSYTKIEMEIRKGYFGFDIIENKKLTVL